jgi:hypothetical protein
MDTYKDAVVLNDLWLSGKAPWRLWEDAPSPAANGERRAGTETSTAR